MNISIEFTLTPLQADFEPPIIAFIIDLRKSGYKVIETPLSTQIYGEFDAICCKSHKRVIRSYR